MLPFYQFESFQIGPITIYVWGLFVALGIIAASAVALKEARRKKVNQESTLNLIVISVLAALIAARVLYVALFWDSFSEAPLSVLYFWNGGMVFFGGALGGLLAGWGYLKRNKMPGMKVADIVAVSLPLGLAIGRVGCHLIKDHMGTLTSMPWGFVLENGDVRHDTALYSVINATLMFFVLYALRKRITTDGLLAALALVWYGLARFIIDMFRATDLANSDPRFFGLTVSQYVCIVLVVIGIGWVWTKQRTRNPKAT